MINFQYKYNHHTNDNKYVWIILNQLYLLMESNTRINSIVMDVLAFVLICFTKLLMLLNLKLKQTKNTYVKIILCRFVNFFIFLRSTNRSYYIFKQLQIYCKLRLTLEYKNYYQRYLYRLCTHDLMYSRLKYLDTYVRPYLRT